MIDYVEIRARETREVIGIVDAASSIIWKSTYYGVGEFEIYVMATPDMVAMLQEGNYVTRQNDYNVGIIEKIKKTESPQDGKMIAASGRFVKSILDRRVVYDGYVDGIGLEYVWRVKPTTLSGNVETAVRGLIYSNAINCPFEQKRNIPEIYWTDDDVTGLAEKIVVDDGSGTEVDADKQVTYKGLLDYSEQVLEEYGLGAKMWLDKERLLFRYKVYKGTDRSRDSGTDAPIVFSKEFDNLASTDYSLDSQGYKTFALIGGEGEGTDRKCAVADGNYKSGLDRRETFVDASSLASTYTDEDETEHSYGTSEYRKMLEAQGRQSLAELVKVETFDGEIDMTNSLLAYGEDYGLGDIVTIEDKDLGKYINARILSVTEVQDENGYKIDIEYGN